MGNNYHIQSRTVEFGETVTLLGHVKVSSYKLLGLADSRAPLICADGGGNTALEFGLAPDVIVGDMDSFSKQFDGQIIHLPEQDTSDFEKYLSCGFDQGSDGRCD